jgi:hypothetical protein
MTPSSSRHFLADRSAVWNASANRDTGPQSCCTSFALLLLISADYGLPASHAAARELTYPA